MNDPKAILLKILEIVNYTEDKDKFATESLQNVSLQALLDLVDTLPQDKKGELQQKMQTMGSDNVKMQEELKNYFSEDQIGQTIENTTKNAVSEYLTTMEPTLSDSQKQNLNNYFTELAKTASPVTA